MRNKVTALLCLLLAACATGPGGGSKGDPKVIVLSETEYSYEGVKFTFPGLCRALNMRLASHPAGEIVFEDPEGNMTLRKVASFGPLMAVHDVNLRLGSKVVEPKESDERRDPCAAG